MRITLPLGLMLLLAAFSAQAQNPTPFDCQITATLTATHLVSISYPNKGPAAPCIAWRLTYSTVNATGVSISLQGTTNLANGTADPAGWTNLTTPTGSTNPATGTNAGTIASCCDYYPWIRAIAGTFTGTSQTMSISVLGYKGTSASRNTGGGTGTVTAVTGVSPIISSNGTTPAISLDKTLVAQKFFVTAPPTNITGNLPGDLATDTTNHKEYVCNAPVGTAPPACTVVAAAGWLLLNTAGYTLPTATDAILGGVTMSTPTSSVAVATNDIRVTSPRGLLFSFDGGGSALASGKTLYLRVPFACTIVNWSIMSTTAETVTVSLWLLSGGTAIPTVSNTINTSGVSLSAGTAVLSSTLTDFTNTSIPANAWLAANLDAVTASQSINYVAGCVQ